MRQVCDDLAVKGFTAICPDLFRRTAPDLQMDDHNPDDWTKALAICQACELDRGAADIAATVAAAGQVRKPLLMHLAGEDEFISPAAQAAIRAALGGDLYDATDAATANGRTADFFMAKLG